MRKKKHPEHVNHERWLVSYADFITLLFAFFTTLYSISTVDQKKAGKFVYSMMTALNVDFFPGRDGSRGTGGGGKPSVIDMPMIIPPTQGKGDAEGEEGGKRARAERVQEIADELQALAVDGPLKARLVVRIDPRGVVVSLPEAGFFEPGSAALRPGGPEVIDELAQKLQARHDSIDLVIEGHTDDRPIHTAHFRSNWELSTARASFVVHLFMSKHAFDPIHLAAAGYGEHHPVASNSTAEGRARNRRVDLVVKPREQKEHNE